MLFIVYCTGVRANDDIETFYSSVSFRIFIENQYIGDVNTLVGEGKLYLNFPQIMMLLGYKCTYNQEKKQMFSDSPVPDSTFLLKRDTLWQGSKLIFSKDYIVYEEDEPYVSIKIISDILNCNTKDYVQSLSIHLYPVTPFPVTIRDRIDALRERMLFRKSKIMFPGLDSVEKKIFKIHSLGYSVGEQSSNISTVRLNLLAGITGELFKGGLQAQYAYNENAYLNKQNVLFLWNKSFKHNYLKEIYVFRANSNLQMYIGRYMTGVSVSNISAEYFNYRDYLFSTTNLPDTDFDIYCNGRFMGRVRSDSLGKMEMNVSIGDGKNIIKCVRYDIYGRQYDTEHKVFMPYQFLPHKKLSYKFSTGYGDLGCGFAAAEFYYGINNYLTVGLSGEVLFGNLTNKAIVEGSVKWSPKDVFRVEVNYMPGVKGSIAMSLHLNKFGLDVYYQRFSRSQNKILFAPLDKASISAGYNLNINKIRTSFSMVAQNYRTGYFSNLYVTLRSLFYYGRWSANLYASVTSQYYAGSTGFNYGASLSYIPNGRFNQEFGFDNYGGYYGSILRSRTQYVFKEKLFCFLDANYGISGKRISLSLGINLKLPSTQLQTSFNVAGGYYSLANTLSGAMQFVDKGNTLFSDKIIPAGTTLLIKPFIDKNGNGKWEKGEVIKNHINISTQYSSDIVRTKSGIYLKNLPVNVPFKVVIPDQPMEDITQQLKGGEYSFILSNYQSDVLYVPINIYSEIYGSVHLVANGKKTALQRIPLRIYKDGKEVHAFRSDEWGTFSYTELKPGKYEIKVYEEFLKRNGYKVVGNNSVKIETDYDGEGVQVDGIVFLLTQIDAQ